MLPFNPALVSPIPFQPHGTMDVQHFPDFTHDVGGVKNYGVFQSIFIFEGGPTYPASRLIAFIPDTEGGVLCQTLLEIAWTHKVLFFVRDDGVIVSNIVRKTSKFGGEAGYLNPETPIIKEHLKLMALIRRTYNISREALIDLIERKSSEIIARKTLRITCRL